jgi:hypothetical protein
MWFLLTALAGEGEALLEYARAFCAEVGNARVVDPGEEHGSRSGARYVYIVVDGGDIANAVRGGPAAIAAVITARALASRLFMFSPALVPDPAGQQSA